MKKIFYFLLFYIIALPLYAQELDEKFCLKLGKEELDNGKYKSAIANLIKAEKELPVLGDYALLWLSDAYHKLGKHEEALNTIRSLLNNYKHSAILRKARFREIEEALKISEDGIEQLFRSYLIDFPNDTEIKFKFAKWLKNKGKTEEAKTIFKEIYIEAGLFSDLAFNELSSSDISIEDMVNRASNLINRREYKKAEDLLRSLITKDGGLFRREILENLGLALFRQKRYLEAAEIFKEASEKYWEVRSLYRAGKKEALYSSINELFDVEDNRIASVLISIAADKRKEGNIKESIDINQKVIEKYPLEKEKAFWNLGWTYFLSGEYEKASKIFLDLYENYKDKKYLYWNIRSLEENGDHIEKASSTVLEEKGLDFYSIMFYVKNKASIKSDFSNVHFFSKDITPVKLANFTSTNVERIEALLDLGFYKEAVSELFYISKNTNSIEDLYYICSKFKELGEYQHLIRLASKVPFVEGIHQFLYPFAYKDMVEQIARKYEIDPLLVFSIIREESRFDPYAKSIAGALGLMQLMPATAQQFGQNLKLGINNSKDILDIENNLQIGIYYLSKLIKDFGSYTYAIAAYNAGEDNVKKWLKNGKYKSIDEFIEDIPYDETRNYVKKVITAFFEYKRISGKENGIMETSLEKL